MSNFALSTRIEIHENSLWYHEGFTWEPRIRIRSKTNCNNNNVYSSLYIYCSTILESEVTTVHITIVQVVYYIHTTYASNSNWVNSLHIYIHLLSSADLMSSVEYLRIEMARIDWSKSDIPASVPSSLSLFFDHHHAVANFWFVAVTRWLLSFFEWRQKEGSCGSGGPGGQKSSCVALV